MGTGSAGSAARAAEAASKAATDAGAHSGAAGCAVGAAAAGQTVELVCGIAKVVQQHPWRRRLIDELQPLCGHRREPRHPRRRQAGYSRYSRCRAPRRATERRRRLRKDARGVCNLRARIEWQERSGGRSLRGEGGVVGGCEGGRRA